MFYFYGAPAEQPPAGGGSAPFTPSDWRFTRDDLAPIMPTIEGINTPLVLRSNVDTFAHTVSLIFM